MRTVLTAFAALALLTVRAERIELSKGAAACSLETEGGRILSYRVGSVETLWMPPDPASTDTVWVHGGIPLAWPWFGRIGTGDESIHGYAWKSAFAVQSHASDNVVLALETESALLEYTVALEGPSAIAVKRCA